MKRIQTVLLIGIFLFNPYATVFAQLHQKTTAGKYFEYDPSDFKIMKGQLGKIKIGMPINDARALTHGMTEKVEDANCFGYGGGVPAFIYSFKGKLLFSLIPSEQNTLIQILVFDDDMQTENGLNSNSKVKQLLEKDPQMKVELNEMNSDEYYSDEVNGFTYIFRTNDKNLIGKYEKLNTDTAAMYLSSKPIRRLNKKADWISITDWKKQDAKEDSIQDLPSLISAKASVLDFIIHNEYFTSNEYKVERNEEVVKVAASNSAGRSWTIHSDGYLRGDLNFDGKDDIIIPVTVLGDNEDYSEYYLFLNTGTDFSFFSKYNSYNIADSICNKKNVESSKFNLDFISFGLIHGSSLYHSGREKLKQNYSHMTDFEHYRLNLQTRKFELVYESELIKKQNNTN